MHIGFSPLKVISLLHLVPKILKNLLSSHLFNSVIFFLPVSYLDPIVGDVAEIQFVTDNAPADVAFQS